MSEPIRALATIAVDVQTFEQLAPEALDRLAELVEARIREREARGGGSSALLSVGEVAELAGLSRSLVYREIERGHLAAYRVGSRLRIEPGALADWKERCRLRPRGTAPEYEPVPRGGRRRSASGFSAQLDAIEADAGRAA